MKHIWVIHSLFNKYSIEQMPVRIPDLVAYDGEQDRHSLCFYGVDIYVEGVGEDAGRDAKHLNKWSK